MTGESISVEGNLVSIDPEKRFFTLEDRQGVIFLKVTYSAPFDQKIAKQKIGYYEKPVVEMTGDNTARLVDLPYTARPEDFPRPQKKGGGGFGGRGYQPRNEKPMLYESVFKSLCEVFDPEKDGKGKSFEDNARRIWSMTKEIAGDMAGISGVN